MDMALERALRAKGYVVDPSGSLGKGSFAEVFKATRHADGLEVAIKQIHKNRVDEKSNRKLLESEIEIMQALAHENVVSLIDTVWEEDHICLVMDYCNGKDLGKYIEKNAPLRESTIAYFGRQIARALSYLHSQRIVHRDLKPQNILVHYRPGSSLPVLRIADFGFARHLTINMADTFCGSPLYMAPEVLFSEGHDERSDLWGAGAILYQCLTKKPPYKAKSIEVLKKMLKSDQFRLKFPEGASAEIRDLIQGLLTVDPRQRMQGADFFRHPFLSCEAAPPLSQTSDDGSGRASPTEGDRGGIPYGDAPATPSPHNSSDSNPSFLNISAAAFPPTESGGDGGSGTATGSGGSFVVLDRDTVELDVITDNLKHHRAQRTLWADSQRWRSAVPKEEVERFANVIDLKIRPAKAIMLAAQRRVDRLRAPRNLPGSVPDTMTKVEALKLLQQALQLLRVGMSQVREYIARNTDKILYTERGGDVVQILRDTFNTCLSEVESMRNHIPDGQSLDSYRGIEVKHTEELLFEYATELSRTAMDLETTRDFPQAEVVYSRILVIFTFLRGIAEPSDEVVLQEYVVSTERRLDAVKSAALSRSERIQRETSRPPRRSLGQHEDVDSHDRDDAWFSGSGPFAPDPRSDAAHGRKNSQAHVPNSYPPAVHSEQGTPSRGSRSTPRAVRKKSYPSPLAHGYLRSDDRRLSEASVSPGRYQGSYEDERPVGRERGSPPSHTLGGTPPSARSRFSEHVVADGVGFYRNPEPYAQGWSDGRHSYRDVPRQEEVDLHGHDSRSHPTQSYRDDLRPDARDPPQRDSREYLGHSYREERGDDYDTMAKHSYRGDSRVDDHNVPLRDSRNHPGRAPYDGHESARYREEPISPRQPRSRTSSADGYVEGGSDRPLVRGGDLHVDSWDTRRVSSTEGRLENRHERMHPDTQGHETVRSGYMDSRESGRQSYDEHGERNASATPADTQLSRQPAAEVEPLHRPGAPFGSHRALSSSQDDSARRSSAVSADPALGYGEWGSSAHGTPRTMDNAHYARSRDEQSTPQRRSTYAADGLYKTPPGHPDEANFAPFESSHDTQDARDTPSEVEAMRRELEALRMQVQKQNTPEPHVPHHRQDERDDHY